MVKPPDDKKYQKLRRDYRKAGSPSIGATIIKGHIKFYDVKSRRKAPPLAEIKDTTYAYAVYLEQSVVIESSTLIKLEGTITVLFFTSDFRGFIRLRHARRLCWRNRLNYDAPVVLSCLGHICSLRPRGGSGTSIYWQSVELRHQITQWSCLLLGDPGCRGSHYD